MKNERILDATFWLCLLVLALSSAVLAVNWVTYQRQGAVLLQMAELQRRVAVIEEDNKSNTQCHSR